MSERHKIKKIKKTSPKTFKPGYFLIKWGNGTISVLYASDEVDLFIGIDSEGDPFCAKIYILPKYFHLITDIRRGKLFVFEDNSELKRFKLSDDIFSRVYSY